MFPLFSDTPLSQSQVIAATRLMLAIARVDGEKTAEEEALIRTFYTGCAETGADWPAFDSLDGDFAVTATDFPVQSQRDMVLAFCLMVAFADGRFSTEEELAVRDIADKIGVDGTSFEQVLALVKDNMLTHLSHLPDAGSVAMVARELG